jgi:SAM-dependent methyltransferase
VSSPQPDHVFERWRRELDGWGIPAEILATAPESPWSFPVELFRRRAGIEEKESSPSTERALEALPEGGSVLDVGVGGGAASLPLADRAGLVVGVDRSEEMLSSFRHAALERGVAAEQILGEWPDVESETPACDVVVCHHVLYNGTDLEGFVPPLDAHAGRRVVIEMTSTHPLAWMTDLWQRFHGLERPSGPTADDALEGIRSLGFDAQRQDHQVESSTGFARRKDAIALVRRRLCLPEERDDEIAEAIGVRLVERNGLWSTGPRLETLVTMWWDATR